MTSHGHRSVLLLVLISCLFCQISSSDSPASRFKFKSQVNDIRVDSRESTARDGGYDDGGFGGGDGLGSLLGLAALLLSGLALLAALAGPLLTLGFNNMFNTGGVTTTTVGGAGVGVAGGGVLPVIPAGRRRRRHAMGEDETQEQAISILQMLDKAIENYESLDNKNMKEIVCDIKNGGLFTSGLSKVTKQFLLVYKFLRNVKSGELASELKAKTASIVEAISSKC